MELEWAKVAAGSSSSEIESPTGVIGEEESSADFQKDQGSCHAGQERAAKREPTRGSAALTVTESGGIANSPALAAFPSHSSSAAVAFRTPA